MPLTIRTQQWLPYSQTSSEQATFAWTQGGWRQQQLDDGPCWMRPNELSPTDEASNLQQSESSDNRPQGSLISASWNTRRTQSGADSTISAHTNESITGWMDPEYWPLAPYDMPDTPGPSTNLPDGIGEKPAALPLFLKGSDLQIPEPASATSSSFSPDAQHSSFQFGANPEPASRRTSLKRSPSFGQCGLTAGIEEVAKPKPKRGRPRLPRNEPHVCDTSEFPCTHVIDDPSGSRRVPHNQVEQKYRNGLNAELERLREAVAVAPSRAFAHLSGSSGKPSKAMVLSSAIDYIKSIEAERDQLAEENQLLRGRNKRLRREKKASENE